MDSSAQSQTRSQMLQAAPYFLVEDVFATAEYYRDTFGFEITGFYGEPPSFTIMRRDGVAVMLKQRPGATRQRSTNETPGADSDAYFWVSDAVALAKELRERGATFLTEPTDQQIYNGRDFQVRDCDQRILNFGQLLD